MQIPAISPLARHASTPQHWDSRNGPALLALVRRIVHGDRRGLPCAWAPPHLLLGLKFCGRRRGGRATPLAASLARRRRTDFLVHQLLGARAKALRARLGLAGRRRRAGAAAAAAGVEAVGAGRLAQRLLHGQGQIASAAACTGLSRAVQQPRHSKMVFLPSKPSYSC